MKLIKFKVALTLASLIVPTMALAQQPVTVSPDKVFDLKIKASDVNKISNALGKMPFEDVADLIVSLRQQIFIQAQEKPVENNKMGNIENNQGIITQGTVPKKEPDK